MNKLRIDHTKLKHGHLMAKKDFPSLHLLTVYRKYHCY